MNIYSGQLWDQVRHDVIRLNPERRIYSISFS